jgi:hypothetical protein
MRKKEQVSITGAKPPNRDIARILPAKLQSYAHDKNYFNIKIKKPEVKKQVGLSESSGMTELDKELLLN